MEEGLSVVVVVVVVVVPPYFGREFFVLPTSFYGPPPLISRDFGLRRAVTGVLEGGGGRGPGQERGW